MVKRIAEEWLWLLGVVTAGIGFTLIFRDAFWRVGRDRRSASVAVWPVRCCADHDVGRAHCSNNGGGGVMTNAIALTLSGPVWRGEFRDDRLTFRRQPGRRS